MKIHQIFMYIIIRLIVKELLKVKIERILQKYIYIYVPPDNRKNIYATSATDIVTRASTSTVREVDSPENRNYQRSTLTEERLFVKR